jgi:hypothetical protein
MGILNELPIAVALKQTTLLGQSGEGRKAGY